MSIRLGENNYGKQRVRVMQVTRHADRHDVKELTLGIRLEGDFEIAHSGGDNSKVLPTDTMKNTVYALASQHRIETPEGFLPAPGRTFSGQSCAGLPCARRGQRDALDPTAMRRQTASPHVHARQ